MALRGGIVAEVAALQDKMSVPSQGPESSGNIRKMVSELHERVSTLAKELEQLRNLLDPVLAPSKVGECRMGEETADVARSAVVGELISLSDQLEVLSGLVGGIIARLDI